MMHTQAVSVGPGRRWPGTRALGGGAAISARRANGRRVPAEGAPGLEICGITLATRPGISAACDCDLPVGRILAVWRRAQVAREMLSAC